MLIVNFHLPAKMQAPSPHGHAQHTATKMEMMMWGMNSCSSFGVSHSSVHFVGLAGCASTSTVV